jgi:hypothetical protein
MADVEEVKPTGRASIFRGKKGGDRVQGILTPVGSTRFEQSRKRLARLAGREVEHVSDGDVIEFEVRGEENTRLYLEGKVD